MCNTEIETGCRDVIRYQVGCNSFDRLVWLTYFSATEQTHTGTENEKAKGSQCVRVKVEK